jgi:hypothetical protein
MFSDQEIKECVKLAVDHVKENESGMKLSEQGPADLHIPNKPYGHKWQMTSLTDAIQEVKLPFVTVQSINL